MWKPMTDYHDKQGNTHKIWDMWKPIYEDVTTIQSHHGGHHGHHKHGKHHRPHHRKHDTNKVMDWNQYWNGQAPTWNQNSFVYMMQ
jgi:hypothetical protein